MNEIDLKKIAKIDLNDPKFIAEFKQIEKESQEIEDSAHIHDWKDLLIRYY